MKSTAPLVAAAAMMFAPSAYAREQTIDMAVMITSSDIASTRDRTPVGHLKEIPIGLRAGWPIRLGQPIAAATGDAPRLGAAGRCGGSSATTQGHRSISRLTGRVGAGPGRRARRRCRRRNTSARSPVGKTDSGSSNPATTVTLCAPGPAPSRARFPQPT